MDLYTLTNRNGLVAKITNLGGHLPLLGSIVGRYANRIAKGAGPARGCLGRLISVTTNGALRPDAAALGGGAALARL